MNIFDISFDKLGIKRIYNDLKKLRTTAIENAIQSQLNLNPRYLHPLRLQRFEEQIFSQNGEDGILQEIFHRIGVTNKYFSK